MSLQCSFSNEVYAPCRKSGKNAIMKTKKILMIQWSIHWKAGVRL